MKKELMISQVNNKYLLKGHINDDFFNSNKLNSPSLDKTDNNNEKSFNVASLLYERS